MIRKLFAKYAQIQAVSFHDVLATIPNKRIAAHPMVRRTLTQHELDRMGMVYKDNPTHVVIDISPRDLFENPSTTAFNIPYDMSRNNSSQALERGARENEKRKRIS